MKFEVGKKYRVISVPNKVYSCVWASKAAGVLSQDSDGYEFLVRNEWNGWEEVPPPLTFGDLKVGEKFRWAGPRDCGPVVCMRIRPIGQSGQGRYDCRWLALEGPNAGTAWATSDADLVERVS